VSLHVAEFFSSRSPHFVQNISSKNYLNEYFVKGTVAHYKRDYECVNSKWKNIMKINFQFEILFRKNQNKL
jgi:hypothetical protein